MSESQALVLRPISERPPGVTPKQWRRAQLLGACETAYEECLRAGYAPQTARKQTSRLSAAVGVRRAQEALASTQADRARGLIGAGKKALEAVDADVKDLDPRDRLAFGLKAYELGHQLGENVEVSGSADAWQQRLRRAIRLAYRFGLNKGRALPDVVSPPHQE